MPRTIDDLVKQIDVSNSLLITRDFIDFSRACYVSSRDKVETFPTITPEKYERDPERYSNNKAFEELSKKIKQSRGTMAVLVAACDATHYNFINGNFSYYDISYINKNAKTWITTTTDGKKYGVPVQIDHDIEADKTIGRVHVATPFVYKEQHPEDLFSPDGHIEIIFSITDKEAIERIIDGRYMTMSVSAGAKPETVTCSICGRSITDQRCKHTRGKTYPPESDEEDASGPGQQKGKLAFWKWGLMHYREASFVGKPADPNAAIKKFQGINLDGIDATDAISRPLEVVQEAPEVTKRFMIMVGDLQDNHITNLETVDHKVGYDELVLKDSITDGNIVIAAPLQDAQGEPPVQNDPPGVTESRVGDGITVDEECNCSQQIPEQEAPAIDKKSYQLAVAGLVHDMLSSDVIALEDAVETLASDAMVYIPIKSRTREAMLDILEDHLESHDAKLTAEKRNKLRASVFCGPNRSFPVPDCAHVTAARRLIGRYKGEGSKERILACVNRKAKTLGCDKDKPGKDSIYIQQEADDMKFQFNDEKELLASPPVLRIIDELKTEHEQAMDKVRKQYAENEKRFKGIAIDAIISASLKLNKPLTAKLKEAKPEDHAAIREELVKRLESRTLDSLSDTLNDLNAEVSAIVADTQSQKVDPNTAKVEDALKQPLNSAAAVDKAATDVSGATASEDLNNGIPTQDTKNKHTTPLPSFLRKRE